MCGDTPTTIIILIICFVTSTVLLALYTNPNPPKFSIEEFLVPAFNKTSDQTEGDIYFDLKLSNMNSAMGIYYDDPLTLVFSYNPPENPYQKYAWVYTLPAFYQGNGKSKHIRTFVGDHLQLPSMMVVEKAVPTEVVNIRIDLIVYYRFKKLWDSSTRHLEVGADTVVDGNTGGRLSTGRIMLVESDAAAGGPIMLIVLFTSFLLIMSS